MTIAQYQTKEVTYAYSSIHDFFDHYNLQNALQQLESIIKAATKNKSWKKDYPYTLIYFMEQLEQLCTAAFVIYNSYTQKDKAVLQQPAENSSCSKLKEEQFVSIYFGSTVWNCFPRHLTYRQYCNPFKAIQKFAGCMTAEEWKKTLKEFTEYGLSKEALDDAYPPYNILVIRLHLLRLIEACHLLEVRTYKAPKTPAVTKQKSKK
jgi:hypothetical protein